MELANIEKLIEKYFEATTTVAEEQKLQQYFSQDEVAPHLEEYRSMFQYFSIAKEEQFTKNIPLKSKRKNYYRWASVAAVAVLALGVYFGRPGDKISSSGEFSQMDIEVAQKALAMLTVNLSEGVENLEYLQSFNKGAEKITHLNEFKKSTNRLLKNEQ